MTLDADRTDERHNDAPAQLGERHYAAPDVDEQPSVDLRSQPTARGRRRPSRLRFWWRRTVVLTVLMAIVAAGWLGVSAVLARKSLLRAQTATAALRQDLERGDSGKAAARLISIGKDTERARSLTSTPLWRVAGRLPVAGQSVRTVRGLAFEADTLSTRVLPHFVALGEATSNGGLRNGDRVDVDMLRRMHSALAAAAPELEAVVRRAGALPDALLLTPVARARTLLLADTTELARTTTGLRDALSIAPAMLGADGPRRYFVALQTNAELRGSGGLLGAYAILEADDGRLRLSELGSNKALQNTFPKPTDGLDPDFAQRYQSFGSDGFWLNSNMSAHFPTVSKIWSSMYERTTSKHIDGSIAIDPIALAEILRATGPATGPGGERITAENIVELTEKQIYARYPALLQDPLRDRLQLDITRALYDRLIAPVSHEVGLLPQLGAAAAGGHVRISSNIPGEQVVLEGSSVGGALPATDGPYLQVALNNAGGTKLDYYLTSLLTYAFEARRGQDQDVSLTLKLRNGAPASGLPEYVVIRPDLPNNKSLVPGQNRIHVSIYAGRGAVLRGAGLDGQPLALDAGSEQGHPVWSTFITLDPGQERTIVLALTELGIEQRVLVVPPPTVTPGTVEVLGGSAR